MHRRNIPLLALLAACALLAILFFFSRRQVPTSIAPSSNKSSQQPVLPDQQAPLLPPQTNVLAPTMPAPPKAQNTPREADEEILTKKIIDGKWVHLIRRPQAKYPLVRQEFSMNETTKEWAWNRPLEMVADHAMVQLAEGVSIDQLRAELVSIPGLNLRSTINDRGLVLLAFDGADQDADALPRFIQQLNAKKQLIRFAEPDFIVRTLATPNDPSYLDGSLWGLNNTGQSGGSNDADIDAPEAWDTRSDASSVLVAVIDTGIRMTHEDLKNQLWKNPLEIAGDGIDNDGNNFIDDVHGINAITGSGNPNDDNGHGTHVAGSIAAQGNNGLGVVGVAWKAKILSAKFLSDAGSGAISDAIICINYAVAKGAKVISNSWGGGQFSQSVYQTILDAGNQGVLLVFAAGNSNSNNDANPTYPASYQADCIVGVAASTRSDVVSNFSNFGVTDTNLAAPGSSILSCGHKADDAYISFNGTSMATPHVAGALALIAAQFPSESSSQWQHRLLRAVDRLPALQGKVQTGGRLNIQNALTGTIARPLYDDFAEAGALTSNIRLRLTNRNATTELLEQNHASAAPQATLWFNWTAPNNLPVVISTRQSQQDTLLAVYTGNALASLVEVASNDNFGDTTSRVRIQPTAGVTYQIAISSRSASGGLIMLTVSPAPVNDDFTAATVLSGRSISATHSNVNAVAEVLDPVIDGAQGGASVWFQWTAPTSETYVLTTLGGSNFDTLLGIYTGDSLSTLANIGRNDDMDANFNSSRIVFSATTGTRYWFFVDGKNAATGNFRLTLSPPPINDMWANAIEIPTGATLPFLATGNSRGSGYETGEELQLDLGRPAGSSVWWKWKAPRSADFLIDTLGSSYDTMLAVYSGSSIENLTKLAANDDVWPETHSRVVLPAAAGVTYFIRVDGYFGRSGDVSLNVREPFVGWTNDFLTDSIELDGIDVSGSGSNVGAGVDISSPVVSTDEPLLPGEPLGSLYDFNSVWWHWTAPMTGSVRIDPNNVRITRCYMQGFQVINSANPVAFSNLRPVVFKSLFNQSGANLSVTRGTTYYFRFGHDASFSFDSLRFTIKYRPAPRNLPPVISEAVLNATDNIDAPSMLQYARLIATDRENDAFNFQYIWEKSKDGFLWEVEPNSSEASISPEAGYFWRGKVRAADATSDGVWVRTPKVAVDLTPVTTAQHGVPYEYDSGLVLEAPISPPRLPITLHEICKSSATARWVELLVQKTTDLRRYQLVTTFGGLSIRFADIPFWEQVPGGSIIVIYNGASRDAKLPPDDLNLADRRLILGSSDARYFSSTDHLWTDSWIGAGNPLEPFQGRGLRVTNRINSSPFAMEWGGSSGTGLYLPTFSTTFPNGQVLKFIGAEPDQMEASTSWNFAPSTVAETSPGEANSPANEQMILRLRARADPLLFRWVSPPVPGLDLDPLSGIIHGNPNVPGGGIFQIKIEAYHAFGSVTREFTLRIDGNLSAWREANEWQPDGSGPNEGNDADFDHDGIKNLIEYAFGSDARNPQSGFPPEFTWHQKGAHTHPALKFRRMAMRRDVDVIVESSQDLRQWQSIAISLAGDDFFNPQRIVSGIEQGAGAVRYVMVPELNLKRSTPPGYLRVRVIER